MAAKDYRICPSLFSAYDFPAGKPTISIVG